MSENSLIQREAVFERRTAETRISVALNLDGTGKTNIETGFGLFNHMLALIFFWGEMDLDIVCSGDLDIDAHHSMEDTGLCLGAAFSQALGDCRGIERTGYGRVPMDEALAEVTVDLSGRPWLVWRGDEILPPVMAGEEKDVWREFYKAFASSARCNLHVAFMYGKNGHHLLESAAKSLGVALRQAIRRQGQTIRSTKGALL